jgi:hypothetical protein
VRIPSIDGSFIQVAILNYETPEITDSRFQSNWLIAEFRASCPQGSWARNDAFLLTPEVALLADWLEAVAHNNVHDETIEFLEPNLKLVHVPVEVCGTAINVCLELELRPPWAQSTIVNGDPYVIMLRPGKADLTRAAHDLREDLKRFPVRALDAP